MNKKYEFRKDLYIDKKYIKLKYIKNNKKFIL